MQKIRLENRGGEWVANCEIPQFKKMPMPEVILWGERFFIPTGDTHGEDQVIYWECLCWPIVNLGDAPRVSALPEDAEIEAAHPLMTGDHALYAESQRIVSAKSTKIELVNVVNWLLARLKEDQPRGL